MHITSFDESQLAGARRNPCVVSSLALRDGLHGISRPGRYTHDALLTEKE
jgi:hypothetical protein